MKAHINIAILHDRVYLGDIVPVFVHLHAFHDFHARKFDLFLICEEKNKQEPQGNIFFDTREWVPFTKVHLLEKEFPLEPEPRDYQSGFEKNYALSIRIPTSLPPTEFTRDREIVWRLDAKLDKPHSVDIHASYPFNVYPEQMPEELTPQVFL